MTKHAENHLLFRRFLILALTIAVAGIMLANLLVNSRSQAVDLRIHDRLLEWKQAERGINCPQHQCALQNADQKTA